MGVLDGVSDDVALGSVSDVLNILIGDVDFVDCVNYCVAAGVLIEIRPVVGPAVVFVEFDGFADVHAVCGELHEDAVGSVTVLVVFVFPNFEHHDFGLFDRVGVLDGVGDDVAFGGMGDVLHILVGNFDFVDFVNNCVAAGVLIEFRPVVSPAVVFVEFDRFAVVHAVCGELYEDAVGSVTILVVFVFPDFEHHDLGLFDSVGVRDCIGD